VRAVRGDERAARAWSGSGSDMASAVEYTDAIRWAGCPVQYCVLCEWAATAVLWPLDDFVWAHVGSAVAYSSSRACSSGLQVTVAHLTFVLRWYEGSGGGWGAVRRVQYT